MSKPFSPIFDMPDLTGKVVVITGANVGIGLHTFKYLALQGAKVYFTARSESKAVKARDIVLKEHPEISGNRLIWLPLDLSKVDSIMAAVEELKSKENKVHLLINNAGMASESFETSEAGWEMGMAVCHVGHFIFTNGILSLLKNAAEEKSADVRIVSVSSSAQKLLLPGNYQVDFSSPAFFHGDILNEPWRYRYVQKHMFKINGLHYSHAKLANVMFIKKLQVQLQEQGSSILCLAVDPGSVKSDAAVGIWVGLVQPFMRMTMLSLDEGAANVLFAATAEEARQKQDTFKGQFLEPGGALSAVHPLASNQNVNALWEGTEREANDYLAKKGYAALDKW